LNFVSSVKGYET